MKRYHFKKNPSISIDFIIRLKNILEDHHIADLLVPFSNLDRLKLWLTVSAQSQS